MIIHPATGIRSTLGIDIKSKGELAKVSEIKSIFFNQEFQNITPTVTLAANY
ncbi:hypothetical protein VCRA2116O29_920003 [Vibrio crassostreae]|nr:hypothetical protein VCRA2119O48_780003 [Vibrio crassostreae]CAK2564850.1 hypothetical protein VCRA2116O29_920003 [Vibrio crassostreae]CAK2737696.1 hypothetical protein VCRA2133E348_10022 [Vibrio crassostreae]CAK2867458.1 hypothetical protein VCRA2120E331_260009 [Vibrio crassostreae]CAK3336069.1 hypothetical protein VCRA213O314_20022 [Vibrio crassostreae]